jgi:hypothetical protein
VVTIQYDLPHTCPDQIRERHANARDSSTGDLTKHFCHCGLFQQFVLQGRPGEQVFEGILPEPLSLAVGKDGLIGRRISLSWEGILDEETLLAEGIVGFNHI